MNNSKENEKIIERYEDYFENGVFSPSSWSAPNIISPVLLKSRLDSFNLEGRKVADVDLIGLCYSFQRCGLEEQVWNDLSECDEYERFLKSRYDNFNSDTQIPLLAQLDEPLRIKFADGDVLEILVPFEGEFRISMNAIPWAIDSRIQQPNVLSDEIFQKCIGCTITSVEVNTFNTETDNNNMDFLIPGGNGYERNEYIADIILRFDDQNGLKFYGWFDYFHVEYVDHNNHIISQSFKDIEPSLFNWEDFHIDTKTGFVASSSDIFFGKKGVDEVDVPYLTITSSSRISALYISDYDFDLFAWCIAHFTHRWFDQYDAYYFKRDEWVQIMNSAANVLNNNTFRALLDFTHNEKLSDEIFKNRDKYQNQFNDIKKWTEIVAKPDEEILVLGF